MEEIRDAALAYYLNLPENLKNLASAKFKEIDSDGSGTISIREFKRSMGSFFDNDSKIMKRIFKELDKNGDGKLDFNEYITLYYLVESGRVMVYCAGHGCEAAPFLKGLYFTCVDCFHQNEVETFNLCTSCYRNGDFDHDHTNFADNHILLISKAACSGSTSEVEEMGKEIKVHRDSLSRPEKRKKLSFNKDAYVNHVLMENTGTNNQQDFVVNMPEQDEIFLTAKSFSKATSTDWTFLRIALCLEIMSLCFDQLSSPSKPTYALFGMLLAISALLNCICELIHKGIKERVVLRRWGMLCFGTLPDFYGLVAGIFQCICSTIQYVYFIRHDKNPIKVSLLPTIFVICLAVSRVNWNGRNETTEQNDQASRLQANI